VRIILSSPLAISVSGKRVRDPAVLKQLHGLADPDEPIVEYFDEELAELGLGGGYLHCVFDADTNQVCIVTEFSSPRELSKKELRAVIDETHGQWLDGVGESLFDEFCAAFACDLEISSRTTVTQDAGRAWKPAKGAQPKRFPKPKAKPAAKLGQAAALAKRLFAAGSTAEVKKLLARGADANARDEDGLQPLHLPAILRRAALVRLLLDHGADVNGKASEGGGTPLMFAAAYGLLPSVRMLLAAGASVDQEDDIGRTALAEAVEGITAQDIKPKPEVIRTLLKAGARITPKVMIAAATEGSVKVLQLLQEVGADFSASFDPLSAAVYMGNTGAVKWLLRAGANPNCMVYQQTALAAAQQRGETAIVKLLIAAGAR
jgi:ankyrin repeat protein